MSSNSAGNGRCHQSISFGAPQQSNKHACANEYSSSFLSLSNCITFRCRGVPLVDVPEAPVCETSALSSRLGFAHCNPIRKMGCDFDPRWPTSTYYYCWMFPNRIPPNLEQTYPRYMLGSSRSLPSMKVEHGRKEVKIAYKSIITHREKASERLWDTQPEPHTRRWSTCGEFSPDSLFLTSQQSFLSVAYSMVDIQTLPANLFIDALVESAKWVFPACQYCITRQDYCHTLHPDTIYIRIPQTPSSYVIHP